MFEGIITILIVAIAAWFVGRKFLRPLWRKEPTGKVCDFCTTPCAAHHAHSDPNLCCQAQPIRAPLPQRKPQVRAEASAASTDSR